MTTSQDLAGRLTPDNLSVNNGVLQVAHSIFKRWRPLYRSDELFTEINHVLDKFATAFLALFEVRYPFLLREAMRALTHGHLHRILTVLLTKINPIKPLLWNSSHR